MKMCAYTQWNSHIFRCNKSEITEFAGKWVDLENALSGITQTLKDT